MSLREIARQRLAIIRGETGDETNLKQRNSVFHLVPAVAPPVKQDPAQKTANNEACFTVSLPRGGNGETRLPDPVQAGIKALANMSCPARMDWDRWRIAVADARRLAGHGWAAKAVGLGWTPVQIFGAVTDAAGDPYSDGLAVWLNGRRVLAITATCATAEDGGNRYSYNRREQVGARLLWEMS